MHWEILMNFKLFILWVRTLVKMVAFQPNILWKLFQYGFIWNFVKTRCSAEEGRWSFLQVNAQINIYLNEWNVWSFGRSIWYVNMEIDIQTKYNLWNGIIVSSCWQWVPKSSLFGRISVPSSAIHASTYTKSLTNDGRLHLRMAALPRNTNSSITRVW